MNMMKLNKKILQYFRLSGGSKIVVFLAVRQEQIVALWAVKQKKQNCFFWAVKRSQIPVVWAVKQKEQNCSSLGSEVGEAKLLYFGQ